MATYTKTCSNNSNYSLRLELSESNVDIVSNTSVINYWLYLDSKYTRFENWNVTYTLNIGSEVSVNTTKSMSMPSVRGEPLLLVSGSRSVTHNNDGTKSLSVSCSVSTATSQSYLPGSATISGETFVLTTIARKSTIGSVTERPGYPVTINVTRYSSSFTHTLSYTFGSMSGTIVSKSSDLQITWTPPITLYTQMIGLRYATGKVIVETFNGNTSLGTTEATLTLATSILYYPPNIDVLKYERGSGNSSSTWVANPNGSDIRVYYNATIISGIVGNTTNLVVKLDNTTKSSASGVTSGLKEHYIQNIGTVTTHQVSVNMSDTIGSNKTWNLTVTTIEVPFDININLPGLACGKVAEKPKTLEFAEGWGLQFGSYGMQDFVVEQGTSGIWTYRKWNSGICEYWGKEQGFTLDDGWHRSPAAPFTLVDEIRAVATVTNWYGNDDNRAARANIITCGGIYADGSISIYDRNYDGTVGTGYRAYNYDVKARWK